jgi:hypothetical protein
MSMSDLSTARGLAARIGGYCWVEQQFFSLFGGWVPSTSDPESKLLLAELGEHAGWRARRWFEALPTAPPGADSLVLPPAGAQTVLAAAARAGQDAGDPRGRLVLAAGVLLPALSEAMEMHLASSSTVSTAPVRRLLEIGLFDISRDRAVFAVSGLDSTPMTVGADSVSAAIVANKGFFGTG